MGRTDDSGVHAGRENTAAQRHALRRDDRRKRDGGQRTEAVARLHVHLHHADGPPAANAVVSRERPVRSTRDPRAPLQPGGAPGRCAGARGRALRTPRVGAARPDGHRAGAHGRGRCRALRRESSCDGRGRGVSGADTASARGGLGQTTLRPGAESRGASDRVRAGDRRMAEARARRAPAGGRGPRHAARRAEPRRVPRSHVLRARVLLPQRVRRGRLQHGEAGNRGSAGRAAPRGHGARHHEPGAGIGGAPARDPARNVPQPAGNGEVVHVGGSRLRSAGARADLGRHD